MGNLPILPVKGIIQDNAVSPPAFWESSRSQTPRLREASNEREAPIYNSQLQVIFSSEGLNNG